MSADRSNIDIIRKEIGEEYSIRFERFDDGNPVYSAYIPNAKIYPLAIIMRDGKPDIISGQFALMLLRGKYTFRKEELYGLRKVTKEVERC